jgi:uncharacterized protein YggU (UPF0235/DUF167 family)
MKITVLVKTQAQKTHVEKVEEKSYRVWVKSAPKDGKANEAMIKALAGYFDLPKSRITILQGITSKQKVVVIS